MPLLPRLITAATTVAVLMTGSALPHLRQHGTATQLIVDGQPFLARGGEVSNSHGEPDYLRAFWPKFKALYRNTLVVPVYPDVVEPTEGRSDWATVDGLLRDARAHGLRLVLLWFGSWKNSMSCYAPAWVKAAPRRFPRARDAAGRPLEILTPCDATNRDPDARRPGARHPPMRGGPLRRRAVTTSPLAQWRPDPPGPAPATGARPLRPPAHHALSLPVTRARVRFF